MSMPRTTYPNSTRNLPENRYRKGQECPNSAERVSAGSMAARIEYPLNSESDTEAQSVRKHVLITSKAGHIDGCK